MNTRRGKPDRVSTSAAIQETDELDQTSFEESAVDISPEIQEEIELALTEPVDDTVEVYSDLGHGFGKFLVDADNAAPVVFPTAISTPKADAAAFGLSKRDRQRFVIQMAELGRKHVAGSISIYTIGEDALLARTNIRRRLDSSGLGKQLHKIILAAGLSKVVPRSANIRLITQIPIGWFGQVDQLKNLAGIYFVKPSWATKARIYRLDKVNIFSYPESLGMRVVFSITDDGEKVANLDGYRIGCVDIGTKTTNVGVFHGMKFIPEQSFTIEAGMSNLWEHCSEVINKKYGRKPHLDDIEQAMRLNDCVYMLGATEINLMDDEYLPAGVRSVSETIISGLQNELEGGTLINYFICGGGGWPWFEKPMRREFGSQILDPKDYPTAHKVPPWMYNVIGLKRLEKWRARTGHNRK